MKKSTIGTSEWILLYIVFAFIDVVQFIIAFTGVGAAINVVADPIIGGLLIVYFQIRGVSMINRFDRIASLLGVIGFEAITGGIAPAWIIDIWLIQRSVKKENALYEMEEKRKQDEMSFSQGPLNEDGVRKPPRIVDVDAQPLNVDGVRPPRGGLR